MFAFHIINVLPRLIVIFVIFFYLSINGTCHGPITGVRYNYEYNTELILNNEDGFEAAGFQAQVYFNHENIWQNSKSYLSLLTIESLQFKPRALARGNHFSDGPILSNFPQVLVQHDAISGYVENFYVPKDTKKHKTGHLLEPTQMNLIVSILNALRSRFGNENSLSLNRNDRDQIRKYNSIETPSVGSLLSPQVFDSWEIQTKFAQDHDVPEYVNGWQNITLQSKIYQHAQSKLATTFNVKLLSEKKISTGSSLAKIESISDAVKAYGDSIAKKSMFSFGLHFIAEKAPCEPHFCDSLEKFIKNHEEQLSEDRSIASSSMSVAYLRFLNYIRANSASISRKQISEILARYSKSSIKDGNVLNTIIDTISASRHGQAMLAAFQFLDLPQCQDEKADLCERFLVGSSISSITSANMGSSFIAEHSLSSEHLLDLLLPLINTSAWKDERVKHAYGLTLATLLHSYHVFEHYIVEDASTNASSHHHLYAETLIASHSSPLYVDLSDNDSKLKQDKLGLRFRIINSRLVKMTEKVIKYLITQLDNCVETDCRVVYLYALGNARILTKHGILHVIRKYTLNSGKRESVAAMKALRDCIEFSHKNNSTMDAKLLERLKHFFIRVVYNSTLETTTRLIGAELLAKYVDHNGEITYELVNNIDMFPSELATMIWKRAIVFLRERLPKININRQGDWHLHSTLLSGSSTSFKYIMGGTGHCNASYGVFLELLKGKLPKETNFNVELGTEQIFQDIINVGLFARGLQSFAGSSDDDSSHSSNFGDSLNEIASDDSEEESTLAGMSLQILGNQLRPFLFFRSTSELMSHMWSGTGSELTPVFRSNLLLADYFDVRPLINGFIVEQTLRGMLSLDLSGEVQVSIWNRNSHSNVQTSGAILFQGAQEVHTTDRKTSARKFFSFGSESRLNFITDFDFYNNPYRICIQITQPEFVFRHNNRKYEQVHSDFLHRRIYRRSYKIPAKSYVLNRDNSEMCALMNQETD